MQAAPAVYPWRPKNRPFWGRNRDQSMRSMLFVPGDRPDRFVKAEASGADAVILDLEDAVAPERRPLARESIAAHLAARPAGARSLPLWVRINPIQTADALADLGGLADDVVHGAALGQGLAEGDGERKRLGFLGEADFKAGGAFVGDGEFADPLGATAVESDHRVTGGGAVDDDQMMGLCG